MPKESFWIQMDKNLFEIFHSDSIPVRKKYDTLFSYFITGFLFYRTPDLSNAIYPGAPSRNGKSADKMEGFTRILPLISVWLYSGRDNEIQTIDGQLADLAKLARDGLISGTDSNSLGYWGDVADHDQRINEAADVALSLWLLRDSVWKTFNDSQKEKIVSWLLQINGKKIADNNWHLHPVLINEILRSLGYPHNQTLVNNHYSRFKSFYRGNGWFSDGPGEVYDFYNAWEIHYALFWLNNINPAFDPTFINESLRKFLNNYKCLISTAGIPITGRSICYRMAASAPLIMGAIKCPEIISPGMARRAFDCIWEYFIMKGAVEHGRVTQGYFTDDLRFLDNYSGPASSLASLRSLIIAFYHPENSHFWNDPEEDLPIECGDYEILIPEIKWKIVGFKENNEIQIIKTNKSIAQKNRIKDYGFIRKVASIIFRRPFRPENHFVKYELSIYSSRHPFCVCGDNSKSIDFNNQEYQNFL